MFVMAMLNLVTLPIPKTLTNYYVVVSTTRVDLNVNDAVQVSYKKLGNSPRHTILSHASRAIASDILTNVCTIQMSIVWALHWISTVNMKVEVCARIAVTTHKASTVTNASQHFIVLMINLLMLPTYANHASAMSFSRQGIVQKVVVNVNVDHNIFRRCVTSAVSDITDTHSANRATVILMELEIKFARLVEDNVPANITMPAIIAMNALKAITTSPNAYRVSVKLQDPSLMLVI